MTATHTLILGATGKTGRRVADLLQQRGIAVQTGSRHAVTPFDWNQPDGWAAVLRNVSSVYVSYFPDLAVPGAAAAISRFVALAKRSGVQHLVLLSGRGEPEAQHCEQIVRDCGIDWTLVRASWFAQNFSEGYLLDSVRAGEVMLPVGAVGEPFVDVDDIAEVAAAALTDRNRHAGHLYEVTGPRLLTFAEAVSEIGRATQRDIRFTQVSSAAYLAALQAALLPDDIIELVTYLFNEVLDGRNAKVCDGVMRALGRSARDFADFARRAAASGVWNV